jgi:hypothetical protein
MKQTTTIRCLALDDEPIKDTGNRQLPSVLKVTVVFLCLVIVVSYATAPPVASLADMEKRITSDKDEYYLGETVNVKVQLVNPLDHEVRLEPITRITYGTMQAGKPWISADVNIDIVHGSTYLIPPHGNLTILDEALSPTEPGEFTFNVLGESLAVMIHPYKWASLISPNVYLNISAPNNIRHGERFTAEFGIVNDNPYHVSLPAYSSFRVSYGYTPDDMTTEATQISWITGASIDIEPHSSYVYKAIPFFPSELGDYILVFKVSSHEVKHIVRIDP